MPTIAVLELVQYIRRGRKRLIVGGPRPLQVRSYILNKYVECSFIAASLLLNNALMLNTRELNNVAPLLCTLHAI